MRTAQRFLSVILAVLLCVCLLSVAVFATPGTENVPAVLSNVTADDGDGHQITVSWSESSDYGYYRIWRQTNGGEWILIMDQFLSTSYDDGGLVAYNIYRYKVCRHNEYGDGEATESNAIYYVGPIPGNITTLSVTLTDDLQVSLNWTASARAETYRIWRSVDYGIWEILLDETTVPYWLGPLVYLDSDVTPEHTYHYSICGENGYGAGAETDSEAILVAWTKPGEIGSATAAAATDNVTVTWTASDNTTAYALERAVNGGAWAELASDLTALTYTDTDITCGTSYQYRIYGINHDKNGDATETLAVTVPYPVPGVIGSVTTAAVAGRVTVNWTASENATAYTLERAVNGGAWTALSSDLTGLTYADTDVKCGMKVQYRVRGTNLEKSGNTAQSSVVTVPDPVPGDEYSQLISVVEQLAVDVKLDSKIATTPEYALADLQKTLQARLGNGYLVVVTLIDSGFNSSEKTVSALFLPAAAAGSLRALVRVTDLSTNMVYESELTFAIAKTSTAAAMPTGDMMTVAALVSVLAVLSLAGVIIFKKRDSM